MLTSSYEDSDSVAGAPAAMVPIHKRSRGDWNIQLTSLAQWGDNGAALTHIQLENFVVTPDIGCTLGSGPERQVVALYTALFGDCILVKRGPTLMCRYELASIQAGLEQDVALTFGCAPNTAQVEVRPIDFLLKESDPIYRWGAMRVTNEYVVCFCHCLQLSKRVIFGSRLMERWYIVFDASNHQIGLANRRLTPDSRPTTPTTL
jgi:hypothetical protein